MQISNWFWCAGWFWVCLCAESVFVLWRNSSVPSLARFAWPVRLIALLLGALWVFGTQPVMPCVGWSLWLTRLLGCCGWTVAVAASMLEKWQPLSAIPHLSAGVTLFAAGVFFAMVVPYSIAVGPCYPPMFFQLAPFLCQLLVCAFAARHVWKSDRCDYSPEVERDSLRYDRRTRRLCLAFLAAIPVLSAPTHFVRDLAPMVYAATATAALAVVAWSLVDLLEPTFRFARSDIGFSSGFASVAVHEDAEAQAMLRSISPDNPAHMRIALDRCREFEDLKQQCDRPELVVRQFIADRGIEASFRLFVAIMLRNDCDDENLRRRLTDAIFTIFIIPQEVPLADDAKAMLTSDVVDTSDQYLLDGLVRVLNGHLDMNRYRWKDLRLDQLRNRPICIPGIHPDEPAAVPAAPAPDNSEQLRLENERIVDETLRQMQRQREERLARYRASEDFILH